MIYYPAPAGLHHVTEMNTMNAMPIHVGMKTMSIEELKKRKIIPIIRDRVAFIVALATQTFRSLFKKGHWIKRCNKMITMFASVRVRGSLQRNYSRNSFFYIKFKEQIER